MGAYAFVFVLFFLNGQVHMDGNVTSKEVCEAQVAKIPEMIANYNSSSEPNKVTHYAAGCTPTEKAPQGKAM